MSKVKQYRKKPVVIKAQQVDKENWHDVMEWSGGKEWRNSRNTPLSHHIVFTIQTLEGNMAVQWNDYIIKGVKGEFYPVKPDIFRATYEPVEASS